jgi:hypothetical protein
MHRFTETPKIESSKNERDKDRFVIWKLPGDERSFAYH